METEIAFDYQYLFAERAKDVPRSFIREILKVASNPEVISFAGGLPNPELFPVEAMKKAAEVVFSTIGKEAMQYSSTEGFLPLRQFIADRYKEKEGLIIPPENILITSGSQQGLDLLGKVFINENDSVIIEEPGYLGAIQAFSCYGARFLPVLLNKNGIDPLELELTLTMHQPKLMYTVPAFQNPSGVCYSEETVQRVVAILEERNLILIEDAPYKELAFSGETPVSFYRYLPEKTVLLGSFSKIIVPGFRMGWIVAPTAIMKRLLIAKQAADLHTNYFTQRLLYQFLVDNNLDEHINQIKKVYGEQRDCMLEAIRKNFPAEVKYTVPDGGMFLWVTLPERLSSMELFHHAIQQNVAFVPGNPFYIEGTAVCNTLRLNFSNSNPKLIEEGISRLGKAIKKMMEMD